MSEKSHFQGRDIVSIEHLTTDEVLYIIAKAREFKQERQDGKPIRNLLQDRVMAYAFFEPSNRTRISFLRAARKQGMDRIGFGSAESTTLKRSESVQDTLKMLEGYEADVLVIRHSLDGAAQYAADKLKIPVINAGDGRHEHPTQTLLDLMAIQETQGKLEGLKIALVGDLKYERTVHSLIKALRNFQGNTFYLVNPDQLAMPEEYTLEDDGAGRKKVKSDIFERVSLEDAISRHQCDIIYMIGMQLEGIEESEKKEVLGKMQLKPGIFKGLQRSKKNTRVLHPLPISSSQPEIAKTFARECPEHAYFYEQAANGLLLREVLLCALLGTIGDDFKGKGYNPPTYNDSNTLIPIERKSEEKSKNKDHIIRPVYSGTVIDHIPEGMAIKLYHALGLGNKFSRTVMAQGLNSRSMNSKEIMMLSGHELSETELNTIAMIAPGVTINIVRNSEVAKKYKTQLPDKITGLLTCSNNRCISNDPREDAPSIFYTQKREPVAELSCHYCDTAHSFKKGNLITQPR
jgi:aspartate carbamoyltransferase catalytic subunit